MSSERFRERNIDTTTNLSAPPWLLCLPRLHHAPQFIRSLGVLTQLQTLLVLQGGATVGQLRSESHTPHVGSDGGDHCQADRMMLNSYLVLLSQVVCLGGEHSTIP